MGTAWWFGGNALLALLAAGCWGVGDYAGGVGVKAGGGGLSAALRVVLFSHLIGAAGLAVLAFTRRDAFPHGALLVWGLAAGCMAAISLLAFFMALSRGGMGVSAALSGVLAAAIPALVAAMTDGAPGWRKGVGFVIAAAAIWLIAAGKSAQQDRQTILLAICAGAGFGIYFIGLKYAGAGGVVWPTVTSRLGSIATCSTILLFMRRESGKGMGQAALRWILGSAFIGTVGDLLFVAATRAGRLDVAAVLASLYPVSTILLAAWRDHERPTRRQAWGMAVAGVAVVLVAG